MIKSFLSFILIGLLFFASLGFVVYRLQDTQFVVSQARQVNLYGRLAENASGLVSVSETKAFGLSERDITDILKNSVDGEQFYGFLTSALNAYLPWLAGKTSILKFSYDLSATKQKLANQTEIKIRAKYDALATCSQTELRQWNFEESMPPCRLADGTLQSRSVDNQIQQAAEKIVEDIPDSINAGSPSPRLQAAKSRIALVFKSIYLIWGLTALLTILLLIFLRSRAFITLAVCFLLVGMLQVAFSLVGWDWIGRTVGDFVNGVTDAKSVIPVIIDLISVIIGAMKTAFGNISIGFLGTGVALLVFGIISKFHKPKLVEKLK